MKKIYADTVEKYLNGAFEYESEKLLFDVQSIEAKVVATEPLVGQFKITSKEGKNVIGFIQSSSMRMSCRAQKVVGQNPKPGYISEVIGVANNTGYIAEFEGNEINVEYVFDPTGLEPGDIVKGDIQIISDAGEYYLPFNISVNHSKESNEGDSVRNLFHLTNLAQTDFDAAIRVFYSKDFLRIFDGNDRIHLTKYRGFSNIEGNRQALEDFLIAINKKKPVTFSLEKNAYEFTEVTSELRCEIILKKNTWGYFEGEITSDTTFLVPEKERISPLDFEGNECKLVFYIKDDYMHEGKNFGKITVKTKYSEVSVVIIARKRAGDKAKRASKLEMRSLTYRLMHNYLLFRTRQINLNSWVRDSMKIVERMNQLDDKNPISRLYQAQLLLVEERTNEAKWILDHVNNEMNIKRHPIEYYSYYLYLTALYERDDNYANEVTAFINEAYEKNLNSMPLLWMLIYLDENLGGNNTKKLAALEKIFRLGNRSPIIYVEGYNAFVTNPATLTKLSDFEIQVLNFAVKNGKMSRDIIKQVSMLAQRQRDFSEKLIKLFGKIYELYNDPELVDAVCSMLIRNGIFDEKYHKWFALGVKLELKITKLYEYFMYSAPAKYDKILPKAVIMYFGFQNQLSYEKKAFLYANLIKNKKHAPDLYEQYYENMQVFAIEQVLEEHINEDIAVVFEEVLSPELIRPNMANHLARLIFARAASTDNKEFKNVVIIQEEFVGEFVYEINEHGSAYPLVYSRNISVFFEDDYGQRTLIPYEDMKRLINENNYVPVIRRFVTNNLPFFLYLCEGKSQYISVDEDNVDFCRDLVESEYIAERLKADLRVGLLHHYYENDQISTLDEFLLNIDTKVLSSQDRGELIDFFIRRTLYEQAYEMVCIYGDEKISPKSCVKICSHMIEKNEGVQDDLLVKIAYDAFRNGKYDVMTLEYLVKNFDGLTKELRNLWKAARAFDVDYRDLTEKILLQMLFTKTTVGEKEEIFDEYIKNGSNSKVEMAYLSYAAYDFFVKERLTDKRIFEHLIRNYRAGEELNDACKLALLQYLSENQTERSERIKDMIIAFVQEFLHKNIYFKFFHAFTDEVPELSAFSDTLFVEYRTNPNNRVVLHYILEDGEDGDDIYRTEDMRNMYGGVFSKEFILFFGENLQYYVTEERNGREMLTLSDSVSVSETASDGTDSRYNLLNDMVVSRTLQDEATLIDLMEEYVDEDYFSRKVFEII